MLNEVVLDEYLETARHGRVVVNRVLTGGVSGPEEHNLARIGVVAMSNYVKLRRTVVAERALKARGA